jgi:hypothetical protein
VQLLILVSTQRAELQRPHAGDRGADAKGGTLAAICQRSFHTEPAYNQALAYMQPAAPCAKNAAPAPTVWLAFNGTPLAPAAAAAAAFPTHLGLHPDTACAYCLGTFPDTLRTAGT